MEEKEIEVYCIKIEDFIGNMFCILNSTDVKINKVPLNLFNSYVEMVKEKSKEMDILMESITNGIDYESMIKQGIFIPKMKDTSSKCYDEIVMLKELSPEEYKERYQQHPKEILAILEDESIQERIISEYNKICRAESIDPPMYLNPMLPTKFSKDEREQIKQKERAIFTNPKK